jgi:multiple sugar transport system substrate-binding protein
MGDTDGPINRQFVALSVPDRSVRIVESARVRWCPRMRGLRAGEADMTTRWRMRRRDFLGASALAAGSLLVLPGKAPAQGGAKPLAGTILNISCWSAPYPKYLADYLPEFEQATGAKVNYETPSFPIYNQRVDIELSTKGSAYDVLNVTFIYSGRWIGAGWFTPLDDFLKDPKKTPADWGGDDFLAGVTATLKDKTGRLYGIPWIADIFMAGASRYDLIEKAGKHMPDTFDDVLDVSKAVHKKSGVPAYVAENHYGWTFIPWLHGFGGDVFRGAPDDLMPVLDTPEAAHAADFYANLLRSYGPDGAISYTYDQVVATLKQGRVNYSTNNETFLVQMGASDSKVASTCNFSMFPAGPKGRFPGVATHGWGIPIGSKNKDAAWEFIKWAMSKQMVKRMVTERGFGSITRRSLIESPDFKARRTINGHDISKIYLDTIDLGARGYMKYRTVPVYPQVDKEIDIAIQKIISQQTSAKEAMKQAQENAVTQLKRSGVKL